MSRTLRAVLAGAVRHWVGPMARTGRPSFALGPAPVDLRLGARSFSIARLAVSGYAVAMHALLWAFTARERWLWVTILALGHTLVVVPLTNSWLHRSPLATHVIDVAAMCAGVVIVGEPALMPYWTPIVVASSLAFAGGRQALWSMATAVGGIPAAYLLTALVDRSPPSPSELRLYGLTTAALWGIVGVAYVYAVGASVNRTRAELAAVEAEREKAVQEADDNALLVRTVVDAAPVGLSFQNRSGRFVYVNNRLAEIMDMSLFEIAERGVAPAIDPSLLPIVETRVTRALEDGTGFTLEYRTRSGSYLRHFGTPVATQEGTALISMVQDLSAERRAARDLLRMSVALDLTGTAVAMWDRDDRIVMANRVFRELWSRGEDPVGMQLLAVMGESARPLIVATLGSKGQVLDHQVRLGDGSDVWMSFALADLVDAETGAALRTMAARDVSDIVRSRHELEGLLASKDQFIASVSHELRTPLTAVVGLAAEMSRGVDAFGGSELEEMSGMIAEQATEVASLVEDLLVAARAEAGVLSISPTVMDLGEVVAEAIRSTSFGGQAPSVPAGLVVEADPMRVRQIVRNLVTNSIRYGGPTVVLEMGAGRSLGYVDVCDDGPPIPDDQHARMFEAYQRAHERVGTPDSVGLGLTVSRTLARMMGGDVTYRHDGRFSRFRLSLPLHHVVEPGPSAVTAAARRPADLPTS